MIILNAGVPRSGTVLVNAIIRELLSRIVPQIRQANPHGAELTRLVQHLQSSGLDRYQTVVVHTHSWTAEVGQKLKGSPHVRAIANYRDPRDVCVSLMKLHDQDLDVAAKLVEAGFRDMQAYADDTGALVLPYELLVTGRAMAIYQIARQLDLWPGMDEVARVTEATEIEKHREIMEKVQAGEIDNLKKRKNTKRVLVEDPKTLINDRHIQSGVSGRWRQELDAAQQDQANARFEPLLKRYGYWEEADG